MNANDFDAVGAWAAKGLPARIDAVATARLLGFAEHDIPILMAARKLTPLGDPAANATKWFATVELIRLATDKDWLNKATREVSKYWRHKRERRGLRRREAIEARPSEMVPHQTPSLPASGTWD